MKKFLSALVASVILLSCFSLALADDKIPTEDKPESITIDYSYNGVLDVEPYLTAFEEYFEATYGIPVTVNLQTAPDDIDVIKTAVAAGTGPDLWHMDVNYFSSFRGNVIQPLSTYLDDDIWAEYLNNGVGVWKYEDAYYALPVSFSVVGMLYNKTALEDANITLGTTWTIDEFESALETAYAFYKDKTVTYSDGNEYPYFMLSTQHTMYYWWLFYGVYGGTPMYETNNLAQEAFVSAITKMAEWRSKGYLSYGSEVGPVNTTTAFANAGNILFWPTGDWSITALTRLELGIESEAMDLNTTYASITAPTAEGGVPYTEIYNQGIVLNANTTGWEGKCAAELAKFLCYDDDNWYELFGPGAFNYCMPGKTAWAEKYTGEWIGDASHAQGFLDTVANGVCCSPDYDNDSIDVTSMITEVILSAFNMVDEAGTFDEAAVRELVTSELEAKQELYNIQLEENDRELDNPDATVK